MPFLLNESCCSLSLHRNIEILKHLTGSLMCLIVLEINYALQGLHQIFQT